MRFEIVLLVLVGALLFHIYTDGKYLKQLVFYKKYAQMAGVVIAAFVLYILVRKNPKNAQNILMGSNEYLKYLPVDKNATSMISPILDFTSKRSFSSPSAQNSYSNTVLQVPNQSDYSTPHAERRASATKRSVSGTKKKFVASRQAWRCGGCNELLKASFEVDHKIRLADGGSNHVDNLIAYCRECHGDKTTIENL
jgi:5-methylcytosine-specific restriction endonuclease McrA